MDSEYAQWAEEQRARKTEDRTETPQLVVPLSAHVGTEPRPQPTTDDRTRDPLANLVRHDDDFSLSLATRVDEVLRDEGWRRRSTSRPSRPSRRIGPGWGSRSRSAVTTPSSMSRRRSSRSS